MNNLNSRILFPLLFSITAIVSMIIGMRFQRSLIDDGLIKASAVSEEEAIKEALYHIKEKYYGTLDMNLMTDDVLREMVEHLDPYSHYFKKEADKLYNNFINGTYEGLGFQFMERRDSFFVTSVVPGGPAKREGMKPGDIILYIDSIQISSGWIRADSIRRYVRNKLGEEIEIVVKKPKEDQMVSMRMLVSPVKTPMIEAYRIAKTDVLYIAIKRFSKGSFTSFMDALDRYNLEGIQINHLILDLRGNPGGLMNEAIKLLNQLIEKRGLVLASTKNKGGKAAEFKSNGRGFLKLKKIVVLIDGNSASASEIVAGSLQDHDRALIIGQKSFGKGLIQQNYNLSNEASINLTIGEYMLPSGRHIYKDPTIENSDTSFYSVRLNRPLTGGQGIVPDKMLPYLPCSWDIAKTDLAGYAYGSLIDSSLLHISLAHEGARISIPQSLINQVWRTEGLSDACMDAIKAALIFEKWRIRRCIDCGLTPENSDILILEAIRLIGVDSEEEWLNSIL